MGINSDVVLFRVESKKVLKQMAHEAGFKTVSAFVHYKVFGGTKKMKDTDSQKLDSVLHQLRKLNEKLEEK